MTGQLRLFHRGPREGHIEMVRREWGSYAWRCTRCGRHGTSYSSPRHDLLEWAQKNHRCPRVWEDER